MQLSWKTHRHQNITRDTTKQAANIVVYTFNMFKKDQIQMKQRYFNILTLCCCRIVDEFEDVHMQPWSEQVYEQVWISYT